MADTKYGNLFEIMSQSCEDLESDGIDSEFLLDAIDELVDALGDAKNADNRRA